MARYLRNFAPGYDLGGTPDWCELIFWESLEGPMSHYEVQYGIKCGRYCMPVTHDTGRDIRKPKCNDGHHAQGYHTIEIWGAGGNGGGGCCCTQPEAYGGQGQWLKECRRSFAQNYCFVVGHGGCCLNEPEGRVGCYTMATMGGQGVNSCFCARGGACAPSNCCANSICNDRTFEAHSASTLARFCHAGGVTRTGPGLNGQTLGVSTTGYGRSGDITGSGGKTGAAFKTIYSNNCRRNSGIYQNLGSVVQCEGTFGRQTELHVGFAPWLSGRKSDFRGGNHIPESMFCFERKTMNYREVCHYSSHCTGSSICQLTYTAELGKHTTTNPGWVVYECQQGDMDGNHRCRNKQITGAGFRNGSGGATWGHNVSGAAWVNTPVHNSPNHCGGYYLTYYLRCAFGEETSCYESVKTMSHGGHPTAVCGGPCCCGGPAGNGAIIWRYR